ncbi:MAG TPA: hypothetical protein PLW67_11020 [Prolixibacteraceae bacterium]|nr:hypothetical protein [Prolixibacteraceae bacterium]
MAHHHTIRQNSYPRPSVVTGHGGSPGCHPEALSTETGFDQPSVSIRVPGCLNQEIQPVHFRLSASPRALTATSQKITSDSLKIRKFGVY